jgi:hypothetical protein
MTRRKVHYVVLGLLGATLLAGSSPLSAGDKKGTGGTKLIKISSKHYEECAKACGICAGECEHCMTHCLKQVATGKKDHIETLRLCADCAEVCASTGRIAARRGPFILIVSEPCARACARCAVACEKFSDDMVMARCAKACRDCERACREMAKHGGSATKTSTGATTK